MLVLSKGCKDARYDKCQPISTIIWTLIKKTVEGYLTSRAGAERSMLAVFLLCQNQLQVQTLQNLVFH